MSNFLFLHFRSVRQIAGVLAILAAASLVLNQCREAAAASAPGDLVDYGVAAPVGQWAWGGPAAAVDAAGRRVIVGKLWSGYDSDGQDKGLSSYLFIDVETGATQQVNPEVKGRGGVGTFLSPENKLYDTLEDQLVEVDVTAKTVRRVGTVPEGRAMTWAVDKDGTIYFAMYPESELLSFNPRTRKLTNHGLLAKEDWEQYPCLAMDGSGWVYAGIMHKRGAIIAFHPPTGERRQLLDEAKRGYVAYVEIWRGADGHVHARLSPDSRWYDLYEGRLERSAEPRTPRVAYPNSTTATWGGFPDGSRFTDSASVDPAERRALILDAGAKEPRTVAFDYVGRGARVHTLVVGPDGKIYGSTGVPLRIFRLDPETRKINDWGVGGHQGHVNQFVRQGAKLYGAVYSSGSLIEYDPARPIDNTDIVKSANPPNTSMAATRRPCGTAARWPCWPTPTASTCCWPASRTARWSAAGCSSTTPARARRRC